MYEKFIDGSLNIRGNNFRNIVPEEKILEILSQNKISRDSFVLRENKERQAPLVIIGNISCNENIFQRIQDMARAHGFHNLLDPSFKSSQIADDLPIIVFFGDIFGDEAFGRYIYAILVLAEKRFPNSVFLISACSPISNISSHKSIQN